jgi:hypothetical protein
MVLRLILAMTTSNLESTSQCCHLIKQLENGSKFVKFFHDFLFHSTTASKNQTLKHRFIGSLFYLCPDHNALVLKDYLKGYFGRTLKLSMLLMLFMTHLASINQNQ